MITIGTRIRQLRDRNGFTQQGMANLLTQICGYPVSRSTLGMWEADKRVPQRETLEAMADYFNVSVDYLLARDQSSLLENTMELANELAARRNTPAQIEPVEPEPPEITMIARAGKRMSPEQRDLMLKWAKLTFPEAFKEE